MNTEKNRENTGTEQGAGFTPRRRPRPGKSAQDRYSADVARRMQEAEAEILDSQGVGRSVLNMLRTNHAAAIGLVIVSIICLMSIFAPLVCRYDPNAMDLAVRLKGPSLTHWLGTDDMGRDVFARVVYGSRISLMIGFVPTFISMVIGTLMGLISGYFGGKTDFVIMRIADVVLSFPSLLLAMVVMYILGAKTINLFIALSIIRWAGTARIVRAQTLSLREKEFVEAAKSMGVRRGRIIFRHILPNCIPNLIVLFTMDIPGSILSESSLSFLGVGTQPPDSSWGLMVSQGKSYAYSSPWLILAPGLAVLITVMAFNFLGDGLRDAIDPYMKN